MGSQHRRSHYSTAFQLFQLLLSERIFPCDYPGSFSPSLQLKIFSTPPVQALLKRCAGFRHFVQGRAGIPPTLFKEDTEQRQCPAPLPSALPEAEQFSSKAGSTPKKKKKKMWGEMSLKEISSAECFRHSKNTFSPTVNFACLVAKH